MPFFQVDDQLPVNAKTRTLIAPALAGDSLGVAALGLWTLAGASSQAALTDGVLSLFDLLTILPSPSLVPELARRLVDAGLWHEPGHGCPDCEPVLEGHWRFHDWWQMRYDRGDVVKTTRRKRAELQKPEIVDAVWARDCIDPANPRRARCRYCGKVVNRKDTRSPREDRPTLDHVDPTRAAGVRNLVVACFGCNGTKGKRTPAQAGMTLLPAPRATDVDVVFPPAGKAADAAASPTTDAETPVSPAVAAEAPASPAPAAATSTPPAAARADAAPPDQGRAPDQGQTSDQTTAVSAHDQSPRAHHVRGAGSGEGSRPGSPTGSGQGHASGHPRPKPARTSETASSTPTPARRRRRRRGRGGKSSSAPASSPAPSAPTWDAGPAPEVPVVGQFGSPWHGWRGAPSPLGDEYVCPEHHLPQPCRQCAAAADLEGDS